MGEVGAVHRGRAVARLRLAQQANERADLVDNLARGVRNGTVERDSAVAEGLEQMAAGLRLLGCAESASYAAETVGDGSPIRVDPEAPVPASSLWGRLRWLVWG